MCLAAPGWAHVEVTPAASPPGVTQRYVLVVPGEKPIPTTRVEVEFPAALRVADVEAAAGWTVTTQTGAGGRIVGALWADGATASGRAAEFGVVARNPDGRATLTWKVIQTYQDGSEVQWTGPPSAEFPAATTEVRRGGAARLGVALGTAALVGGAVAVRRWRRGRTGGGVPRG